MITENLSTKVTNINGIYHVRLLDDKKVYSEMACKERLDIEFCCRWMLRWYDKLGGTSKMADASRHRGKNINPVGKIWYPNQLPV